GTPTNDNLRDTAVHSLLLSGSTLYAGTYSGIYSSEDAKSWAYASTGFTAHNVSAFGASSTNLFVGSNNGGVFTSVAGSSLVWSLLKTGMQVAATTPV